MDVGILHRNILETLSQLAVGPGNGYDLFAHKWYAVQVSDTTMLQ